MVGCAVACILAVHFGHAEFDALDRLAGHRVQLADLQAGQLGVRKFQQLMVIPCELDVGDIGIQKVTRQGSGFINLIPPWLQIGNVNQAVGVC